MKKIKLGSKVRCIYSGFTGTAVYKTEFINGCVQYGVLPEVKGDNKPIDEVGIDSQSLELVKKPTKKRETSQKGGATTSAMKGRGF
ncbi:MAG: hypothetical protein V3U92_19755 [Cellulophaga sp.]